MTELPKALLIDLDDTIIDDSGCVDGCWADACAEAAGRVPGLDATVLQKAIQSYASVWWGDPVNHQRGRLDLRVATREIVEEALRKLERDVSLGREIAERYRDIREERAALIDGAVETLEWLRSRSVRLGMMTNGAGAAQRAKIERFELEAHFEHILIEGEFGCGKPDPRVFTTLLDALGAKPKEAWAIGDNLQADVFGAMDLGIYGIWVDSSGQRVPDGDERRTQPRNREPDRIVASICELRIGVRHG